LAGGAILMRTDTNYLESKHLFNLLGQRAQFTENDSPLIWISL